MVTLRAFLTIATTVLLIGIDTVKCQFLASIGVHTGIDAATGARPARLNIETLIKSGPQWDLFVQALTSMQTDDQSHLTSYYQIAGIHGRPFAAWDGVHSASGPSGDQDTGYCTHNSILFPSWHRPYMALYEQIVVGYAQSIASQYVGSTKATYQEAAETLRIPYWDWASSPHMPAIVSQKNISVTTPNGMQTMLNPLFTYKFHPVRTTDFPTSDGIVAKWNSTVRDPDSTGNDQTSKINSGMDNVGYAGYTYQLFSRANTYPVFATTANSGTSLEAIHGTVHNIVGGTNGEMTVLAYSAFDPIFWLHHVNVDRVFALWQSVYPNQTVTVQNGGASTFTMAYNTIESKNSPLAPFASNSSAMWTSVTARYMKTFGYTYPEIDDWNQTPEELTANVSTQVNALYNPGGTNSRVRRQANSYNDPITEWFVGTAVDRYALGTSFNIYVFLGCPPIGPTTNYLTAPNLAGLSAIFAPIKDPGTMPVSPNYDEIALKKALASFDVQPNDVKEYLRENLEWVVVKANGTIIPNEAIPSLRVWVQQDVVTPQKDDCSFPTYGKPTVHLDVTNTKIGGVVSLADVGSNATSSAI